MTVYRIRMTAPVTFSERPTPDVIYLTGFPGFALFGPREEAMTYTDIAEVERIIAYDQGECDEPELIVEAVI